MVKQKLSDIKVLVWDLDGTLYQSIPEFSITMHKAFVQILGKHKNLTIDQADLLLDETKRIHKGSIKSLQALGCGSYLSIVKEIEELVDKDSYLKLDRLLQQLFVDLSSFRHILLSDTTHPTIVAELEALGLSHTIFELVVGIDDTGVSKPDLSFFRTVLNQTDLKPDQHLMIGDRVEVDLVPAKQLGMKTCLVWSEQANQKGIDYSFPTVYDVKNLFLKES